MTDYRQQFRRLVAELLCPHYRRKRATEALDRWLAGHHAFIVTDQVLLIVVKQIMHFAKSNDVERTALLLTVFSQLQQASGLMVKVTSCFERGVYSRVVRPHMAAYTPEMSGVYMADHKHLQKHITAMSSQLAKMESHPLIASALRLARLGRAAQLEEHVEACRRNIPTDNPSMIHKAMKKTSQRPAVKVIEEDFNPLRKKQIGCPLGYES